MPSISVTALALSAVGAAAGAYGTIQAGQAASSAASYRAQIADNNAKIEAQNAQYALRAGEQKAVNQSLKGSSILGRVKAAQAANQVDVNTGSAAKVQESQSETNELETEQVMDNAQLTAYGYRAAGAGDEAQAGLDEAEAGSASTGADIGAAGSLFSDAGSLGLKYKAVS